MSHSKEEWTSPYSPNLYEGKNVLVTGGSRGGILKECAKQFLIHGAKRVFIMARNAKKLEEVCNELSQFGPCTPC